MTDLNQALQPFIERFDRLPDDETFQEELKQLELCIAEAGLWAEWHEWCIANGHA